MNMKAKLSRTPLVAGAALVLGWITPARADTTVCQYTARPRVCLGLDGPYLLGVRTVVEHWSVDCATTCDSQKFWDEIKLVYASEPQTEITAVGSLAAGFDPIVSSGDQALDEPLMGVKILPIFKGGCGDREGVTSTDLIEARGDPLSIPPYLPPADQMTVVIDDATSVSGSVVLADQIPVGRRFHIHTLIGATPKGAETVGIDVQGAGISFFKYYGAIDGDVREQFEADPDAHFVASRPDTITLSIVFEGLKSPTRILTVVPDESDDEPPDSGTAGGSTGNGSGGNGGTPAGASSAGSSGGCQTGPARDAGLLELAAVAVALARAIRSGKRT